MVLNDSLADAFSKIDNCVRALHKTVVLKKSKLLLNALDLLKAHDYIGSYEIEEDGKSGLVIVNLIGNINKCGIIKPRYPVKVVELERYEKRFLPAKDFGVLIISTNKGLITQITSKKENIGGTLIAYCY